MAKTINPHRRSSADRIAWRLATLKIGVFIAMAAIIFRLWQLQVLGHDTYTSMAAEQQVRQSTILAKRGIIYATERAERGQEKKIPLALNRDTWTVFADTRKIQNINQTAGVLAELLKMPPEEILEHLKKEKDPYEPIKHRVAEETTVLIKNKKLSGIHLQAGIERFYPNNNIGSHVVGFVRYGDEAINGQYGIERSFNNLLAGQEGTVSAESDASGVWITLGERDLAPAENGADIVLTIEWPLQYRACRSLDEWVQRHGASGGSLIILNPETGAIRAMCGAPDFNPNVYNEVDNLASYNNPATFNQYEPGSIFKPITMAAALDQGKVTAETTYKDTGEVKIGTFTMRNSDNKAHGVKNMAEVLEESLNTGAIFAMRQIGQETFRQYVEKFGFGKLTGVELPNETAGDINSLNKKNEIYAATASFGQGITVTPLQMIASFAAIANGGNLVQPYIVKEIIRTDGKIESREPKIIRRVISDKTAAILSGMLVNVVEKGHGKRAGVPGYYIAGKTGTAQIPLAENRGYDPDATIGSFAGFGPVHKPDFVMLVRVDRPKDVQFAESSAAPLFGEVARYILQYDEIPPER